MKNSKALVAILSVAIAVCLTAGCSSGGTISGGAPDAPSSQTQFSASSLTFAASYDDVLTSLKNSSMKSSYSDDIVFETSAVDSAAPELSSDATSEAPANAQAGSDYSDTNVQVEGVDEHDIVKTDGSYIYVLHNTTVTIFEAAGNESKALSSIKVCENDEYVEEDNHWFNNYETLSGLYIDGDRMIVVSDYWAYEEWYSQNDYKYENTDTTDIYIYDISDRAAPSLITKVGQDGSLLDSRMTSGAIFLISSYSVYDYDETNPQTYIPRVYIDGSAESIACGDIILPPDITSTSYTVISAYDSQTGALIANQTVLGGGSTVYMNQSSLYVARTVYDETESEERKDGIYTVRDYTSSRSTEITKFDISSTGLTAVSSASIPGMLESQYSLDEYDGYLRAVTTDNRSTWATYTDEEHGWQNYEYGDNVTDNALYVLTSDMNVYGSVTGLANGEYVYSVRFDGSYAYFCTFLQTDPLFAVDLTVPASPTVLSELKITGFSDYLHTYSEGRLLGLGMEADPETGFTSTMKLTMFDNSDPANVTVKNTLVLEDSFSEALSNPRAILVNAEKNIIAFPSESGYDIYGYSDSEGFTLRGSVTTTEDWYYNSRGLYIGDCFYVAGELGLTVLDLESFTEVLELFY